MAIDIAQAIASAHGDLSDEERETLRELVDVWRRTRARNALRDKYYLGHVRVKDLGISMPKSLAQKIDPRVDWPRKAVLALADRSVLNGFTTDDEKVAEELRGVYYGQSLDSLYRKCLLGQLRHCCGFWTVTDDGDGSPVVSAYPATSAAAVWDDSLKAIRAGLVVAESKRVAGGTSRKPTLILAFTRSSVITLRDIDGQWVADTQEHSMGRPLMEPMPYDATLERPFGRSRITRTVMSLTDDAIRQRARMEVAAESATLPQMWLLGTVRETINENNKFSAAMGVINEVTKDKDGDSPKVWQSAQLSFQPLNDYYRQLACQISAETDVPVSFFGVASDNPSSAEAIAASIEPLVIDAKNLNRDNGYALRNVAYMALAVLHGTDFATERDAGNNVNARFMSPAYPSVVSQSDAMLKQAQAFPKVAASDVALEMLGYTDEQMQRINSDYRRAQANQAVLSLLTPKEGGDGDTTQPA